MYEHHKLKLQLALSLYCVAFCQCHSGTNSYAFTSRVQPKDKLPLALDKHACADCSDRARVVHFFST